MKLTPNGFLVAAFTFLISALNSSGPLNVNAVYPKEKSDLVFGIDIVIHQANLL